MSGQEEPIAQIKDRVVELQLKELAEQVKRFVGEIKKSPLFG